MITKRFDVPLYGFSVTMLFIEGPEDAEKAKKHLWITNPKKKSAERTVSKIKNQCYNGADYFFNPAMKSILIVMFPQTCKSQYINTMTHEKRHIEDFIADKCGIKNDNEAVAYLAGYLGSIMLKDDYKTT